MSNKESSLTPDHAIRELLAGNRRFAADRSTHPNSTSARRVELVAGQRPIAAVLTCADSRVAPEIVFDHGLGDLFVIRIAGNIVTDEVLGTIEFGVVQFHIPLVVVLGHEACGAIISAIETLRANATAPGHLQPIVDALKPAIPLASGQGGLLHLQPVAEAAESAIRANVVHGVEVIRSDSPILTGAIASGTVALIGMMYSMKTGKVETVA